jgi:AcrR family transcriptional regulator
MPSASTNHQKLIETAVELFSLNGYDGVSIRDLCRVVGIKESSFYNHFRGKEELLEHILEMARERYHRLMPADEMIDSLLELRDPADFWADAQLRFRDFLADPEMRKINRILNLEQYRNPKAQALILEEVIRRPLRFSELVFEKFIAQGKIRPHNPRLLAQEYQMPVYAFFLQFLILDAAGQDTSPVLEHLSDHIQFFSQMVQI